MDEGDVMRWLMMRLFLRYSTLKNPSYLSCCDNTLNSHQDTAKRKCL